MICSNFSQGKDKDFDPQTEADRSAQRCIIGNLFRQYPGLKIIGEEGAPTADDLKIPSEWLVEPDLNFANDQKCPESLKNIVENDLVVWVDPLDGTSEYVQGYLEHVTVLIGISYRESAIGGIIHQPYFKGISGKLGRTIWGVKELGTGGYTFKKAPENKFIITTTRSHNNVLVQDALDAIRPDEVLRVGGCGFKVLQLLEGKAHGYVFASAGCKKWDTCAPEAILEADSGVLTDILGKHYSYGQNVEYMNKAGVLATARGVSHDDVLEKIPEHVKKAMQK